MYLADSHTHTIFSHDAKAFGSTHMGNCKTAIEKGLSYLAFTEHYDVDDILAGRYPETDIEGCKKAAEEAIACYKGRLTAVFGIELGDPITHPGYAAEFLGKYNFGFVIGSQHSTRRDKDFFCIDFNEMSDDYLVKLWEEYLEDVFAHVKWCVSGKSRYFDTLAHLTYPCRYYYKYGRLGTINMKKSRDMISDIFKFLISNNIALECNTSGLHQDINSLLPDKDLLSLYHELGGQLLTTGSDSHRPEHIGFMLAPTYSLLKEIGFNYITVFENREPKQIAIG